MTLPAVVRTITLPASMEPELAAAVDLAKAEKAPSTRKAYASDFGIFKAWCEAKGASALPAEPETVASFLASEAAAGTKPSTIARRVAASRYAHKLAGLPTPTDSEGGGSRHKSVETLRGYVRDAELFKDHAGSGLL